MNNAQWLYDQVPGPDDEDEGVHLSSAHALLIAGELTRGFEAESKLGTAEQERDRNLERADALQRRAATQEERANALQGRLDASEKRKHEQQVLINAYVDETEKLRSRLNKVLGFFSIGCAEGFRASEVTALLKELDVERHTRFEDCPVCRANDVIRYDPPLYPKSVFHCRACSAEWEPTT